MLLMHRPSYDDWSWPKGKPVPGEDLTVCAVREVEEETGYRVVLGQPLRSVRYPINGGGKMKESHYWAATVARKGPWARARGTVTRAARSEVDRMAWVDAAKAFTRLTYAHDREPLAQLVDQWDDDRLDTWTVAIVRHARARKRSVWKGGEATRPLTPMGEQQSHLLVPMLSAYGISRVVTSPWERCLATVQPYAEAARVTTEKRAELTEAAHAKEPRLVRELVEGELAGADSSVAICTHRPVLPTVIEQLTQHTQNKFLRSLPVRDPWLRTGEVIVAHMTRHARRGSVVVALEKRRPLVGRCDQTDRACSPSVNPASTAGKLSLPSVTNVGGQQP